MLGLVYGTKCSLRLFLVHSNGSGFFIMTKEGKVLTPILGCRGRYMQMEFQVVMKAAKAELMNFVGKDAL